MLTFTPAARAEIHSITDGSILFLL
ncbi:hypothetical protein CGLO_12632 [Colletotrichum gloeosporioides Cg-14]|uniref:Uncharacterized protein n=1 Tax=Colletotrichum gloeosporioides (strain Cg-14) TaxID=1237896 RepID=T0LJ36_COLGC|nr:hypothetical protein CGLO_12632 [Colletotrichum gloeosporioides Cg-14]